jgi:hypothetical protein
VSSKAMALSSYRRALPIRLALGAILLLAVVGKLGGLDELVITLQRSSLVPPMWERSTAISLIAMESLLVGVLLFGSIATLSLAASAGMSSMFFGYSLWRMYQDIKAPCGCFGVFLRLEPWQSLPLTATMTLLSLWGMKLATRPVTSAGMPAA